VFQPRLSLDEAKAIAAKLNLGWEYFISEYTDPKWPGTQSFLIRKNQDACLFLKTDTVSKQSRCQIHTIKPACCREWKQGLNRPECQQGLKTRWGLVVDTDSQICGTTEQLAELEAYIDALD
jgi:Fe-S-cluster containining protein